MDYEGEAFFDAPFPSDARRDESGRPVLTGFPNPDHVVLVERILEIAESSDGFGVSSGIFWRASAALDPASFPDLAGSVDPASSIQLLSVDPQAPDYRRRYPVRLFFAKDPGPYGAPNLLSIVPLQGMPLRPNGRYAVVITDSVQDESGAPLGPAPAMKQLLEGKTPAGMSEAVFDEHTEALDALGEAGIQLDRLVAITVFTTGDPTRGMGLAIEEGHRELPAPNNTFELTDEHDSFCVYGATIDMPVFQAGEPPYSEEGGGFVVDEDGFPALQGHETARFLVTIPKTTMPEAGYPTLVFSRTGGGGDRPLVDRGVRAEPGGEAIEPGTGPALELARVGFAGASIDGPHGGLRNITMGDEQLLVFNFQNPLALRDNVRQSALELALVPEILENVSVDISDCPGAVAPGASANFDTMAIMGHSMGASIAPLALVYEPRYRGIVLSGAGGSFLANMLYKQKPLPVKPLAELILGLTVAGYSLDEGSPVLSMLQWAGEPADDPVYGRYVVQEPLTGSPRHVLMMQGIVDHYIMPPIANATSLSFGLDLAGDELDAGAEELSDLDPLATLLPLVGRGRIDLPVTSNIVSKPNGSATAVVTQNPEDGIEDGHEVVFQTSAPKHAYACFLQSLAAGNPRVPNKGTAGSACE